MNPIESRKAAPPSGARIVLLLCAVASVPVFSFFTSLGFLWSLVYAVGFVILAASVKTGGAR